MPSAPGGLGAGDGAPVLISAEVSLRGCLKFTVQGGDAAVHTKLSIEFGDEKPDPKLLLRGIRKAASSASGMAHGGVELSEAVLPLHRKSTGDLSTGAQVTVKLPDSCRNRRRLCFSRIVCMNELCLCEADVCSEEDPTGLVGEMRTPVHELLWIASVTTSSLDWN